MPPTKRTPPRAKTPVKKAKSGTSASASPASSAPTSVAPTSVGPTVLAPPVVRREIAYTLSLDLYTLKFVPGEVRGGFFCVQRFWPASAYAHTTGAEVAHVKVPRTRWRSTALLTCTKVCSVVPPRPHLRPERVQEARARGSLGDPRGHAGYDPRRTGSQSRDDGHQIISD